MAQRRNVATSAWGLQAPRELDDGVALQLVQSCQQRRAEMTASAAAGWPKVGKIRRPKPWGADAPTGKSAADRPQTPKNPMVCSCDQNGPWAGRSGGTGGSHGKQGPEIESVLVDLVGAIIDRGTGLSTRTARRDAQRA